MIDYTSYYSLAPSQVSFLANIITIKEPSSFAKGILDPNWVNAKNKELEVLENNNTWVLVSLPPGKYTVGYRWLYKIKYHANGEIERYKAILVTKCYTQEAGVVFHDTFAPNAKVVIKAVIALAASK